MTIASVFRNVLVCNAIGQMLRNCRLQVTRNGEISQVQKKRRNIASKKERISQVQRKGR